MPETSAEVARVVQRYSTVSSFELIAGGRSYAVSHVASDFIRLWNDEEPPAGPAVLVIRTRDADAEDVPENVRETRDNIWLHPEKCDGTKIPITNDPPMEANHD